MQIEINLTPDQIQSKLEELIMVTHNLRYWTKYWNQHYGSDARERKVHWEKKADQLLTELGLDQHMNIKSKLVLRP